VSASATRSPAAGQAVQGGDPPGASRSVSASATWSPAAGQAQFSGSFGTVPNWERKQSQRLRRRLIGVHNPPQRRQRPSTTPHPARTNRPPQYTGTRAYAPVQGQAYRPPELCPIWCCEHYSNPVPRCPVPGQAGRTILNESRNREPPLQTSTRNRIIETRNRKLHSGLPATGLSKPEPQASTPGYPQQDYRTRNRKLPLGLPATGLSKPETASFHSGLPATGLFSTTRATTSFRSRLPTTAIFTSVPATVNFPKRNDAL